MLLRSADGTSYDEVLAAAEPAIIGTCQTILPNGPWCFWDEAANLDVMLLDITSSLASVTEAEVLAGANAALVGDEILQFRTASLIAPATYRLSGLLRGRLGTDHRTATHAAGERFVLLSGGAGLDRVRDSLALRGLMRQYKAASLYQAESAVAASAFSNTAEGLRPLSPVHIAGTRDAAANLAISWIRRTRIPSAWSDGADVPLGEASERYEVEVLSGSTVVRTIAATTPAATYTAAEQAADFGAAQAAITVRITQLSETVGRGTPRTATI
ncbi:GTA baseplate fiber-binding domain-containing protein [Paracraurococcus lichenis]|uniref:Rcc01698-like C-terminal domain-containing protein n=1 Tax=Paracraurococcus lichenis TaxID=3064888 RepID=A0ABT9EAL2_9PROT|nr:hypothetical protein [Paracraurococcus sp. LOR1-02]MDO9713237.1 hypothetical protein [Paracraurococcus sp. LOR1-02]